MEPRTSGPVLTSFLEASRPFLPRISSPTDRLQRFVGTRVPGLTHSQDEVVVGLVVDGVQDVKHVDGEVRDGAEMSGDGLLCLEFTPAESQGLEESPGTRGGFEGGAGNPGGSGGGAALTSEEVVGTSPTAAM